MQVQAIWLSERVGEGSGFKEMSAAWAVKSTLYRLKYRLNGNTVQFKPGDDLMLIGGRSSLEEAFKDSPVKDFNFAPAQGETLYITARRKTHKMGKMLSLLPGIGLKMMTNSSARSSNVKDKMGKLIGAHMKTYTEVHIISGQPDTDEYALPPSMSGAQMALLMKHYFKSEL